MAGGWGIVRGFQKSIKQLVSWLRMQHREWNRTVARVQIKHESQRALSSWIAGNQEPGIGDPTPAVTSQGSGVETNKKGSPALVLDSWQPRVSRAERAWALG